MNKNIKLAVAGASIHLQLLRANSQVGTGDLISASSITDKYPDAFDYPAQPNRAERRAMNKKKGRK